MRSARGCGFGCNLAIAESGGEIRDSNNGRWTMDDGRRHSATRLRGESGGAKERKPVGSVRGWKDPALQQRTSQSRTNLEPMPQSRRFQGVRSQRAYVGIEKPGDEDEKGRREKEKQPEKQPGANQTNHSNFSWGAGALVCNGKLKPFAFADKSSRVSFLATCLSQELQLATFDLQAPEIPPCQTFLLIG
ncbi:uncharacterized protein N7459_006517 [Penicillium hispanicum]|uniref:uncharacterized protein n=1 Tax=Penicillium hispanicum TaxID=1080232 RepID=UPI0025410A29|nr:uncharacterized protein N7459_006517 [Penicillium hispanicum]KAJ5577553.1 hypothetical protein N7459_006517 [Penicillium hispanicum]